MTVSTLNNRVSYAGNGTTTVFSFPNRFLADTDLVVLEVNDTTGVETSKTLTTHYTVTGAGDAAGGSVTMLTAPATGVTLVIYRDPALTQPIDLVNGDPLDVDTGIERGFDRSTLQIQRVRDLIDRSLRLPEGDTGFVAADMELPAKVDRASLLLGFDADGKPMASAGTGGAATSAFMATVLDDTTSAAALGTLGAAGLVLANTFTNFNKWVLPYTLSSDSALEIIHGTSANPITNLQAKHSGIRVERWINKTAADSTTRATGVQGAALSCGLFEAFPTNGSQQLFTLRAGVFVGTPRSSGGVYTDKVAVYGEAQRRGGTDGVWAMNSVTEVDNLDGPTIGFEIDINNYSTLDPGVNPASSFWGLSVVNGYSARGATAIVINRNGNYTNNEWNRGIYVKEVKKIGIEIGSATAGVVDGTLIGNQLADAANTIVVCRATDTTPTGTFFLATNAARTSNIVVWRVDGELEINSPASLESVFSAKQIANGEDTIFLQRNTDTTPTGQFIRCVNNANTATLFRVDTDSAGSDTVLQLSVGGAAAARVSVGANDSGGAGFRYLRVPN